MCERGMYFKLFLSKLDMRFVKNIGIYFFVFMLCMVTSLLVVMNAYKYIFYVLVFVSFLVVLGLKKIYPFVIVRSLFVFFVACIFLQGITGGYNIPLNMLWQTSVFIVGLLGLKRLIEHVVLNKLLVFSFVMFLVYLAICLLSNFISGNGKFDAVSFQFISNLKLFFCIALGMIFATRIDLDRSIDRIIVPYIAVTFFFLMMQWFVKDLYLPLFNVAHIDTELTSYLPAPGRSLFNHPSILAAVSAFFALYSLVKWLLYAESKTKNLMNFIFSTILLLCSNQRQEIFGFMSCVFIVFMFYRREGWAKRLFISSSVMAIAILLFIGIFYDAFIQEIALWGFSGTQRSHIPRMQMYEGAVSLANSYFPLGSGLGTWGGVGALKYDLSLYYKLRYSVEWWWRERDAYLLDAFWPNPIAEGGFIGAIFLLFHYILLIIFSLKKSMDKTLVGIKQHWLLAAVSILFVLMVTPTSPGFQEMLILFFPGLIFAKALYLDAKERGV
jgi:hypothetical protein